MLCMVNHARLAYGLAPLAEDPSLGGSAERKSGDILACDDFSHFACGREFTHWMAETGYLSQSCWWVGENIAWGRGVEGTPREIFGALMRSQTHRENILGGYEQVGIDSRAGSLGFLGPVRVWTQHFGTTRCSATPAS